MATPGEADCSLASKCMDFCQALASQGLSFHFSLNVGLNFTFSLDTRGKAKAVPTAKKKVSPSTQRRNVRRREEFLLKKRQSLSTVKPPVEKVAEPQFSCVHCEYTNVSEKGLRQHIRMKHRKEQLEDQLPQSSSPATPESLRCIAQATSLAGSPPLHYSRVPAGMDLSHPTTNVILKVIVEEEDGEEEEVAAKPKTNCLDPEDRAMFGMLLQMHCEMNAAKMKQNSD